MNTDEMEYSTKDFYLSSCILASGIPLIRLEPINHKTYLFIFLDKESQIPALIQQHWDRKLLLPTRDVIEAINELKTRLYEGS